MRICVTVASEVEFQIRARFVGCRTRCRTLGKSDSSYAGTRRTAGTRCRTLGRPELVGRRNSSMPKLTGRPDSWEAGTRRTPELVGLPELAAGLLGGRNSSDAGTRQCRNSLPDFWEAGTRRTPELVNAGTRCRTFGRPELVGLRNSSMPELAAGLLGGRNSSDAGTRCRTLGRPELVGRRNSSMPELWEAGTLGRPELAR